MSPDPWEAMLLPNISQAPTSTPWQEAQYLTNASFPEAWLIWLAAGFGSFFPCGRALPVVVAKATLIRSTNLRAQTSMWL